MMRRIISLKSALLLLAIFFSMIFILLCGKKSSDPISTIIPPNDTPTIASPFKLGMPNLLALPAFRKDTEIMGSNRLQAVSAMQYWNRAADTILAPHVGLFNAARSGTVQPSTTDTTLFTWALSYSSFQGTLYKRVRSDSIGWTLTGSGPGYLTNSVLFLGKSTPNDSFATFMFRDSSQAEFFKVTYSMFHDSIRIENMRNGDALKASYAWCAILGENKKITTYVKGNPTVMKIIFWNPSSGAGYIENVLSGKKCWDIKTNAYQDLAVCP